MITITIIYNVMWPNAKRKRKKLETKNKHTTVEVLKRKENKANKLFEFKQQHRVCYEKVNYLFIPGGEWKTTKGILTWMTFNDAFYYEMQ